MSSYKHGLMGLLILQVVICVGVMGFANGHFQRSQTNQALVTDQPITAFEIRDSDKSLRFTLQGDDWRLDDLKGLPLNETKVTALVDQLATLKTNFPVTRSKGSHARFQVAEDDFYRAVHWQDAQGDEGDFYVGTSPGIRQSHVRIADDDSVYALNLNRYDLNVTQNDWLNKRALAPSDVTAITSDEWQATQTDDNWAFAFHDATIPADETQQSKLREWIQTLKTLTVSGLASEFDPEQATSVWPFTVKAGEQDWHYQLFTTDEGHYIRRDDIDYVYKLADHDYALLAVVQDFSTQLAVNLESMSAPEEGQSSDS